MTDRASSGVRNIRAMFEAKTDSSPPSRGRSPAGSEGFGARSDSSRPLSKVRTSFVSVDGKSGPAAAQLGLQRKNSEGLGSDSGEGATAIISSDLRLNRGVNGAPIGRTSSLGRVHEEEIGKNALDGDSGVGKESQAPSGLTDKATRPARNETPPAQQQPAEAQSAKVKDKSAIASGVQAQKRTEARESTSGSGKSMSKHGSESRSARSTKSTKPPTTPQAASQSLDQNLPVTKQSTTRKPTNTPETKGATKATPSQTTHLPATAARSTVSSTNSLDPKKTGAIPKVPGAKKPGNVSVGGFVKPPPRSPTRPVKLPAGATATTTSSSAKIGRTSLPAHSGRSSGAGTARNTASQQPPVKVSRPSRVSIAGRPKDTQRSSLPATGTTSPAASVVTRATESGHRQATNLLDKGKEGLGQKAGGSKPSRPSEANSATSRSVKPKTTQTKVEEQKKSQSSHHQASSVRTKPASGGLSTAKDADPTAGHLESSTEESIPTRPSPPIAVTLAPENTDKQTTYKEGSPEEGDSQLEQGAEQSKVVGSTQSALPQSTEPATAAAALTVADFAAAEAPNGDGEAPKVEDAISLPSGPVELHSTSSPETIDPPLEPLAPIEESKIASGTRNVDDVERSAGLESRDAGFDPAPKAAPGPPAEAIAEALAEPAPRPNGPAPSADEVKKEAAEREMEANELAQVDSAAPAPAPELKGATPAPKVGSAPRPFFHRTGSEDLRLPEAAKPTKPSLEEIEAMHRESRASGEAVDIDATNLPLSLVKVPEEVVKGDTPTNASATSANAEANSTDLPEESLLDV